MHCRDEYVCGCGGCVVAGLMILVEDVGLAFILATDAVLSQQTTSVVLEVLPIVATASQSQRHTPTFETS